MSSDERGYVCMFCAKPIEEGSLDPCAVRLVARINRPRRLQKEQVFFCHAQCLVDRAGIHQGTFNILDPEHATIEEAGTVDLFVDKAGNRLQDRHCGFCGKERTEVKKLVAGPVADICDDCVRLCMAVVGE